MAKDSISLTLEPREVLGKQVRQLRRDGQVPAVIHDHGKPSVHVQADAATLLKVWRAAGKHHAVELKTGDQSYVALIKDAEFDPKKHQLRHMVFNAVDRNQKVEAEVPVRPRYAEDNESSPAERNGLIVLAQLDSVQVKAVPSNIPDVLEYDAEKLIEVGDHISVTDLSVPADVEILTEPEHSVATVFEPSALAAANEAAAGDAEAGEESEVEAEEGAEESEEQGDAPASDAGQSEAAKTEE